MSQRTRQEVWEQIKMSELTGSDVVPLPIETAKLLLECARLINEGAGSTPVHDPKGSVPIKPDWHMTSQHLRIRCVSLSEQL